MDNTNIKAWLNYNCTQGNNWIVLYKFDEILSHQGKRFYRVSGSHVTLMDIDTLKITSKDLSHVYFTYMTESVLITLVETYDKQLYLVSNKVNIIEPPEEDDNLPTEADQSTTVDLTDDSAIDQYKNNHGDVKKVDNIVPLPQLESVESTIYQLDNVSLIRKCLTRAERKIIGIKDNEWLSGHLKKNQQDELNRINFMNFIHISDEKQYVSLLDKYIEQSGDTLNLMHNYSVTPEKLSQTHPHSKVHQLILYQNFQVGDFAWLKNFPNIKLLNLFYNHQIEQKHFEQIVQLLPSLEVVNIHFCSRINLKICVPLFKLRNLNKLAIEDPQFWCQKSIHELFILPHEWKNIYCPSLQKVAINSCNLTMDVIDYLLTSCPNINQMTVDENVLKLLSKNIEGGLEKNESIIFNSWQTPNKGYRLQKKISFKNLLKDTYSSQMFSDSMLRKIKEIRSKKGEVEQTSMESNDKQSS
jgi:hypothetical protein